MYLPSSSDRIRSDPQLKDGPEMNDEIIDFVTIKRERSALSSQLSAVLCVRARVVLALGDKDAIPFDKDIWESRERMGLRADSLANGLESRLATKQAKCLYT